MDDLFKRKAMDVPERVSILHNKKGKKGEMADNEEVRIEHLGDGVYRLHSLYYEDSVSLTADQLRAVADWCLLNWTALERWSSVPASEADAKFRVGFQHLDN